MKVPVLLCCALALCSVHARDVYRTDDPITGTEFSDVESPGATRITIEDAPAEPTLTPTPPQWSSAQPAKADGSSGAAVPYSSLAITSPAANETVRNNAGDVEVTIASEPEIQRNFGHQLAVSVDGANGNGTGSGARFSLRGLPRGTHTLSAVVLDNDGNEFARSAPVVVHLHRQSTKFRKKIKPSPAKPPSKK